MKTPRFISLFVALIIFVPGCVAQTAPSSVKQQFNKKFPKATEVEWDKESDSEYEASFKINNVKYSANFATDGTWLETEQAISFKELPDAVLATLSRDYYGVEINEVAKLITNKNENNKNKDIEEDEEDEMAIDLIFDTSGKIVKTVSFEKDEND